MLFSAILSKMQTIITLLRVPGNVGDKDHNDLPVLHHPSLVLRKVLLVNDHPSTNMSIHTKSTFICRIPTNILSIWVWLKHFINSREITGFYFFHYCLLKSLKGINLLLIRAISKIGKWIFCNAVEIEEYATLQILL